jgi:hypothetical protein
VEIEVQPPLAEHERAALLHALDRAGIWTDGTPDAYASAWLRAASREAVDHQPPPVSYARSPRSTLGATRA